MVAARWKCRAFVLLSVSISVVWALPGLATIDPESIVGMWLFDDEAEVATDSSGNGNDGDLLTAPPYVAARFGKGLELNGNNQFVWVREPVGLPINNEPRTVMMWFKWAEIKWPNPGIEPMGYGSNANNM